jgi:hypothetical protein
LEQIRTLLEQGIPDLSNPWMRLPLTLLHQAQLEVHPELLKMAVESVVILALVAL